MFKKGTIVLIPFPFTDLIAVKVRPAIILSRQTNGKDIVVAFISSRKIRRLQRTDVSIKKTEKDFGKTGLKVDSIIKIDKIATLDKKIVLGELGEVGKDTSIKIKKKLKLLFNL